MLLTAKMQGATEAFEQELAINWMRTASPSLSLSGKGQHTDPAGGVQAGLALFHTMHAIAAHSLCRPLALKYKHFTEVWISIRMHG